MIYFITHSQSKKGAVTVIDLDNCVAYEKSEWDAVNDIEFSDHLQAIDYAKRLAIKFNLEYVLFNSRYDKSISEKLTLEL